MIFTFRSPTSGGATGQRMSKEERNNFLAQEKADKKAARLKREKEDEKLLEEEKQRKEADELSNKMFEFRNAVDNNGKKINDLRTSSAQLALKQMFGLVRLKTSAWILDLGIFVCELSFGMLAWETPLGT